MKILFVMDSLGTGGAERSTAEIWYYLRSKNMPIRVVVLRHRSEGIEQEVLSNHIDVEFLPPGSLLSQVMKLKRIIQEFQPDLVHSVLFKSNLRIRLVKMIYPRFVHLESLINRVYDVKRLQEPNLNFLKLLRAKAIDAATNIIGTDHFHAVTQDVKEHYLAHLKVPPDKVSVVYRGRKCNDHLKNRAEVRTNLLKSLNLPENSFIFINIGRQDFQKGQHEIIEGFHHFLEKVDIHKPVYLIIAGRDGTNTNAILSSIKKNNLEDKVLLLGHRNDVNELLVGSDVFILNSYFEGTAGVLIEAQAAALPLLVNTIPGMEEVVLFGRNALSHPTGDRYQLAENMMIIYNDADKREKFSSASLENFKTKFQIGSYFQGMRMLYQKLVE